LMRVAYLCTDLGVPYGGTKGASVHMRSVVSALADAGAEVLVLGRRQSDNAAGRRPGVIVEVLPGPGKGASTRRRLAAEPALASWLSDRLARFEAECLYERLALHSAAGARAASRLRIPHLLEINAPLLEEAASYRNLECPDEALLLERAALSGADLVFAVTQPLADHARVHGARRVEVLPNAAVLTAGPPRVPADPVRAVFAGTLRRWHGVEVIAEAWRRLGPGAPPLLVVGDGDGRHILEAVGAEVTGVLRPELVAAALTRGDIGLAPYAADAPRYFSPLKVFEYLAAGLAVVAADLPGVTSVVGPDHAVLIPAGDSRLLAHAVGELSADPERVARMGAAGRALIAAGHTWAHRAARILEAAGELCRQRVGAK
jgi:glycosyltransferase involved in cell wall biosynthesis